MMHSLCQRVSEWIGVPTALALALVVMPVDAALVRGTLSGELYTAPGELFTIKSPLGPRSRLVDGFERSAGAVTFMDHVGELFGVVCTPNLDVLAGVEIDNETSTAILRNWFREAAFPAFFAGTVPGSSILREEPGEFEGQPAWIAMLHLPGGAPSARIDPATGKAARGDSWRGVVVISRGGHTYLLMTEAIAVASGLNRQEFDVSAPGWDGFLPKLAQFYRGMTFRTSEPEAENGQRLAERPDQDVPSREPSSE